MGKMRSSGVLLAVVLCLLWILPVPVQAGPGPRVLEPEWVRSVKGEATMENHFSIMDPLAVDRDGNVYLVNKDGYLYSYTPERDLHWKVDINQYNYFSEYELGLGPVLDGAGNCYIASRDGRVYKISPRGQVLAEFELAGKVANSTSPVLAADGTLYVVTQSCILYALESETLEEKWQVKVMKGSSGAVTPALTPGGEQVIVGSFQTLTAVSRAGEIAWEYQLPEERWLYQHYSKGSPQHEKRLQVDAQGNIYFLTMVNESEEQQSELMCLAAGGSELRWRKILHGRVSAPLLAGDTLYYCGADSRLYALDSSGGGEKWRLYVDGEGQVLMEGTPTPGRDGKVYFSMGSCVFIVRDAGEQGEVLVKYPLPGGVGDNRLGLVSPLGPRGEFYVCYDAGIGYHDRLAKLQDPTFNPRPEEIRLDAEAGELVLAAGGSYELPVEVLDGQGSALDSAALVLTSSDPGVVTAEGLILQARAAGTARVVLTHPANAELQAELTVEVRAELAGSKLELLAGGQAVTDLKIMVEETLPLAVRLTAADGRVVNGETWEWRSIPEAVAAVEQDGLLRGVAPGSAKVLVRGGNNPGLSTELKVTVAETVVKRYTPAEIEAKIAKTVAYYQKQGAPGTDWSAFALNAVGVDLNGLVTGGSTYLDRLEAKVKKEGYFSQMTDYERTVIGVAAAGADPADFAGRNLLEEIYNYPSLSQGINGAVFGLIALDAANAVVPPEAVHNRESFLSYILNNRTKEGWSYGGLEPDADMTGMALYALAPYRDRPLVKEAGEEAIRWLSEFQDEDGVMKSWGTKNSESCAQALMGITAWGVDPQGELFTKTHGTLVSGLLSFYFEDSGMFAHIYGTPDPAMATDQGLEGLAALKVYLEKGYSDIFYKIRSVSSGPREITALEITPEGLEIPPRCEVQLQAVDQGGRLVDGEALNWSSSNPAVVVIDGDGQVTAQGPGEARITVRLAGDTAVTDYVSLKVYGEEIKVTRRDGGLELAGINRTVALEVENTGEEEETVIMIITLVDSDSGKMVNSSYVTRRIQAGQKVEMSGGVAVPDQGNYQVKAMLWNGWDKLRPLQEAIAG